MRTFLKTTALLFAVGAAVGVASPAGAEVAGDCTATMAGRDVAPLSSSKPSDAIKVNSRSQIVAGASSAAPIDGYRVQLAMGGFKWTIATGGASGNSWSRSVSVKKYAIHGVGLYKVIGTSVGAGTCSGAVLVRVGGRSPLATTAGVAAAALTALGGLGLVAGGVRSGRRRSGRLRVSLPGIVTGALGGLGVIVLLQEYAVAYPTRGLLLTGLAVGIALNLLATNLPSFLLRGRAVADTIIDADAPAATGETAVTVDLTSAPAVDAANAEGASTADASMG